MTSARPRIAVVGAGYWGQHLVRVAAESGVLQAICDSDPLNLERARAAYPGVRTTASFGALLDERASIDAVVLAVPAPLHASYATRALAAGLHVFVEKPLALSSADAASIVHAAARAERKVFVGHVLLYHPAVRALFASLARGEIGDIVHLRSRRLSWGKLRPVENVWWSFAPHDIALMLAAFDGELPASVSTVQTACIGRSAADFAYADFRFAGDRTAHLEVSWLDVDKSARFDVFGTAGVLTFIDARDGATVCRTPAGARSESGQAVLWRSPAVDVPFVPAEPLACELQAFIDWMTTGVAPPTTVLQGRDVVTVLEMTQRVADRAMPALEAIA